MYLQFYGLRDIPFSLTPDPRFLYFTASHREVMANLHYGIQHGKGLIVATGEVGTGKTTVLRSIISRLDRSVLSSYIFNPGLTVPELYQHLAVDFGLGPYTTKSDMMIKLGKMLMMRHSRGMRTILIVDEAQGMSRDLLEEIRLLLNFETYTEKQLQIILVGQPELRTLLNNPDLRQLKQRISLRCEIKSLKADDVAGYIRTRLKVAGAMRPDFFTNDALALIYRASEGIPRLVNNICDNALLTGFATNKKTITADIIAEVAESLDLLQPMIAEDPKSVMEDSMPAMPVMREKEEEDWLSEAKPARRRPNRKRGGRSPEQRRTNQSQTDKKPDETTLSPFKVLSPVESRSQSRAPQRDEQGQNPSREIEENVKAG